MRSVDEDVRFRVLRALEQDPNMSQRALSKELGVSVGLINYCLRGLAEKGQIKMRNFKSAEHKQRYVYVLTPSGLAEKARLTGQFLKRRVREYEALRAEIAALEEEGGRTDALSELDGSTAHQGEKR